MSTIRVVLADDQSIVRSGLALLLEQEPDIEIVGQASDGWEAIKCVAECQPDVVLMDIEMPGLSGLDATRRIKDTNPHVSALILTMWDREDYLFEALQTGALGYQLKSASAEELVGAIRTVNEGQVFIHPKMTKMLVEGFLKSKNSETTKDGYDSLSPREREVLPLLAENYTNQQIADRMHLSQYTIQTYRQRTMKKLDVHSRAELVRYAIERNIISIGP